MYTTLQVNYLLLLSDFHENKFSKNTQILIFMNPSSGSRDFPCGRTDGRTERNDEANNHFPLFRSRIGTLTLRLDTTPRRRIRGVEIKLHTLFFCQLALPPLYILPLPRRLLSPSVDLDIQKVTFMLQSRIEPRSYIPLMVIR